MRFGKVMANKIAGLDADTFWQFSLALYPKVKTLCLQWQDELGANVNLLLLLCYLEQRQLSLNPAQIAQLSASLQQFSVQFTQPLRALRRQHCDTLSTEQQQQLKQALLAAELSLEQLEQQLLLQHCQAPQPRFTPLLETYLALLTRDISAFNGQIIDLRQAIASLE